MIYSVYIYDQFYEVIFSRDFLFRFVLFRLYIVKNIERALQAVLYCYY